MDTPMSSGGYSTYTDHTNDDESRSYMGSSYGGGTTPYGSNMTPISSFHTNNNHLDMLGNDMNDMQFNHSSNKSKGFINMRLPEIEIVSMESQKITLTLRNCDLSFANALRRICIAEVFYNLSYILALKHKNK